MNQLMPLKQRLEFLFNTISSENFLNKKGLGQEVPFFICPYKIEESNDMNLIRRQLVNRLGKSGISTLEINLYELCISIIKEREPDLLERIFEMEPSLEKNALLELLQGILDPAEHLVPAIAAEMANNDFQVMFVSGIGEVFPFLRSHNLLNNLQATATQQPTVFFFPGGYNAIPDNSSALALVLFQRLKDDNYYRAFNIYDRKYLTTI